MEERTHREAGSERGYVLVGVLILLAVAAVMVTTALDFAASRSKTVVSEKIRTRGYYEAEQSLAMATSWLRSNSKNLTSVFSRSNFYATFDRTAASFGANDSGAAQVLTRVKLRGTNDSAILTQDGSLGTVTFPGTNNTATGAAFDPASEFQNGAFGQGMVKITLVDALPVDPSSDFGDPDDGAAAPQTDFYPVFRIDAMEGASTGSQVYGYAIGNLLYDYGIGFYGQDIFELRQGCDSYLSDNGSYSSAARRANCSIGSNGTLQIHQNETLYGSAQTNGALVTSPPFGGEVCGDFLSGCPNEGFVCQGAECDVPGLPAYGSWSSYCPTNQGDRNINSNATLTVSGSSANQKCWGSIEIGNNRTLTLTSTAYPYFFERLDIPNNGELNIAPNPATGTVTIYVKEIVGDTFNGNQVLNLDNKPYQLRIHYLGASDLTLNGTARMNAFIVAPNAGVSISGNFDFFGGIKARSLSFTGNGDVHYDESGDITTLGDMQFTLRSIVQRYR